ncbi:MAG TPA: phosphoenolpyruvate--protein phosphotransferase [Puia sp.]|nr:phosphoenolpyruvate--protein phosphotransferase [Puia sp.]
MKKVIQFKGTGVSPGISFGQARLIRKNKNIATGVLLRNEEETDAEIERYVAAVTRSIEEVRAIISQAESMEAAGILEAQVELLNDPQIERDVFEKIRAEKKNANDAVIEVTETLVDLFRNMNDEYLSARAADVQDIGNRILNNLNDFYQAALEPFPANTILIADDLTPSDTVTLDIKNISGFVTQTGGKTSHAAIIARSRGIPAVAGCIDAMQEIGDDDPLLIDGETGEVWLHPDDELMNLFTTRQGAFQKKYDLLSALRDLPAQTHDAIPVHLYGNLGSAEEFNSLFEYGGEGVGLFRTEFLFFDKKTYPAEEGQFLFYREIALKSRQHPVTLRTLDIGGDKPLSYLSMPVEQNPFLGYRGIRVSLDQPELFLVQLRAMLRASAFGKFRIMFPMISSLEEFREAKKLFAQEKEELRKRQIAFDENIPVGAMIEVPAAAMIADLLAKEADFFSIGTNDLCQYALAADRMNSKVNSLYNPFHPGVLRLIDRTLAAAKQQNIPVSICGELASEPIAIPLLLGMGLREFSMNPAALPGIKNIIVHTSMSDARSIYTRAMQCGSAAEVISILNQTHHDH